MFASRITKDIEVQDGDAAIVVGIRMLSGETLRKARDARTSDHFANLRTASRDLLSVFKDQNIDAVAQKLAERQKQEQDAKTTARKRYDDHDRTIVLNAGITRWSVAEKVNPDSIADLKESVAQQIHEAILDLSLPPLGPEAEEAPKGDSAPSTGS